MPVVFTSKSTNTVNIVSYTGVKPFGMIVTIVSDRSNKLFDSIFNNFTNVVYYTYSILFDSKQGVKSQSLKK